MGSVSGRPDVERGVRASDARADRVRCARCLPRSSARHLALAACTTQPLMPYSADTPPLVLVPAARAGVQDKRARFREIFCAVLETRGSELPDYRPCEDALTRVGAEPAGDGKARRSRPVERRLIAAVVAGIGYECFEPWLQPPGTVATHVHQFGYDMMLLKVDPLSSSANNARQIRDALMAMPAEAGRAAPRAGRLLQRRARYPRGGRRLSGDPAAVAAVVSAAGAVGGSALANEAEQYQADLLRHFPGATCAPATGAEWRACGRRRARLARAKSAAGGFALLFARHVSAAASASPRF